jgi:hypothetical protein
MGMEMEVATWWWLVVDRGDGWDGLGERGWSQVYICMSKLWDLFAFLYLDEVFDWESKCGPHCCTVVEVG